MWLKLLNCEVLAREGYLVAARSRHTVDIELIEKGLHTYPDRLRAELQRRIDSADEVGYDAILLGYGLCCNATAGLHAGRTKLVIPRAHDCITIYLGSRQRYDEQFHAQPGTYYYTADYIERSRLRDGGNGLVPLGSADDDSVQATYQEYVQKFGKDNADYLMEVMGAWKAHYSRAAFIETGVGDEATYARRAEEEAQRRGWNFERLAGDLVLVRRLIEGEWNEEDFLVVPPGGKIVPAYDMGVVDWVEADPVAEK